MDNLIENFSITKEIHEGPKKAILEAIDLRTNSQVVIKITNQSKHALDNEIKIYTHLQREKDTKNIPKLLWTDEFEDGTRALGLDALGQNLEQLYNLMNRRMSLRTLLTLGDLMVKCVEEIHSRGVLHCDIRPEKFLIGRGTDSDRLYLVGFSNAQFMGQYKVPEMRKRICRRASYQSLSSQMGFKYGFRDDLISVGYILVYLHEGQLPWQGILVDSDETRFDLIARVKHRVKLDKLCRNLPECFEDFFHLCHQLRVDEIPDYKEFRKVFRKLFFLNKYKTDFMLDWALSNKNDSQIDEKSENFLKSQCPTNNKVNAKKDQEWIKSSDIGNVRKAKFTKSQVLAQAILDSSEDDFEYLNKYSKLK